MTISSQSRGKSSLQHPLGKDPTIPKRIAEDRLAYLIGRIRQGSITTVESEELSRGYIRLALSIASRYAARRSNKSDDYAAAALFGLAYAISTAREKLVDDNLTGWVIANIRRRLRRFSEMDHMVRVPSTTYHKAKIEGRVIGNISVYVVDNQSLCAGENDRTSVYFHQVRVKSTGRMTDIREILQLAARDETDRKILKMREEGYNNTEIGQVLGISTSYVQRKRSEMEVRFNKLDT